MKQLNGQAFTGAAVVTLDGTKDLTTLLGTPTKKGWLGCAYAFRSSVAGNVNVITGDGQTVLVPVLAGERVDLVVKTILQAGTTATSVLILW